MICSEFVYRSYDDAILPDEDDIYTIEIEPLWSTKTRRRPLGRRRRAEKAVATGHLHPDSLVGQLQAEASDLRMGIGMPKAMPAPALPEISDEELNDMIDTYLGEDSGMLSITAAVVAAEMD